MILTIMALTGLCIGSFVNALVWRTYLQEFSTVKKPKNNVRYSVVKGRSMCPNCEHELGFKDLIPIFSWLFLRGRCRYCQKSISFQYPAVEFLTALLFVTSYVVVQPSSELTEITQFALWLVLLTGFMALIVFDFRWMLLPSRIIYPLFVVALVSVAIEQLALGGSLTLLLGAIAGSLLVGGLYLFLYVVSKGRWVGFGDVRLGFLLGLVVGGFVEGFAVVFFASLLGTIFSLPIVLLKKDKLKTKVPFGPFLIVATILVVLAWSYIDELAKKLLII